MDKPTDEQVKEFWEWCGFKLKEEWKRKGYHYEGTIKCPNWIYPDNPHWEYGEACLPRIDLNNLFRYAVPKLGEKAFDVLNGWIGGLCYQDSDNPALVLFWAIYHILQETNNEYMPTL